MAVVSSSLTEGEVNQAIDMSESIATSATTYTEPSQNQFVFLAGFDGTNNDRYNLSVSGDVQSTNVGVIITQAEDIANGTSFVPKYYPGPGTKNSLSGSSALPWQVTQEAVQTAYDAYNDFAVSASEYLRNNPNGSITAMVTSFSRGGAAAAVFSQILYSKGLVDPKNEANILIPAGEIGISAGLIYDPVLTGGLGNLNFAPNVKNITVVRALDEFRILFPQADYGAQQNINTISVFGNHGDVGGFYDQGLGALYLEAGINFFYNSGLNLEMVGSSRAFDSSTSLGIHDASINKFGERIWDVAGSRGNRTNDVVGTPPTVEHTSNGDLVTTFILQDGTIIIQTKSFAGEVSYKFDKTGAKALFDAINTYGPTVVDALTLVRAIQLGEPLPITASGLKLANDLIVLDGDTRNLNISGAANIAGGMLSLLSLDAAIKNGDNLSALVAGSEVVAYSAQAYIDFVGAADAGVANDVAEFFNGTPATATLESTPGTLSYLRLINSIEKGDEAGIALNTISLIPGMQWVGIAYSVYSIVESLFAKGPPDPWGTGRFVWDGSNISVSTAGETGGSEAVQGVMEGVVATLNSLIERERQQNPGSQLGLIANRMPSIGYDLSGYSFTNIDPLTGAEKNPSLRFDTSGKPINAVPGSPESFQSIVEGMVRSALERGAIAPQWEVDTAKMQTDAGDPKAGLTEEARAGRDGKLAPALTGATQLFRPVALDLDGDGIETIIKSASNVNFDVDDSGFKKKTAWIGADDAILTIDRNFNGTLDSGRELFSNGKVALGRRGLAGMGWVDANYDGKLTDADPVWSEIKVWQDANSDGVEDAGESQTLADLGITELNYSLGTFKQNGITKQLGSPDLIADTEGTRVNVVDEGIVIESSEGSISLLVTRIDDKTAVEANRDGITGFEDIEIIVNSADLLANDTLGGFTGRDLTLTGVSNFINGTGFLDVNGFVHFIPDANYSGTDAKFQYDVLASNGQIGTTNVDVTIQNVNDAPTLDSVEQATRTVYGYAPIVYDDDGYYGSTGTYLSGGEAIYQPYVLLEGWYGSPRVSYNPSDFSRSDVIENRTSPLADVNTGAGQVIGTDIDDPDSSLTYTIANQPQYGSVSINADGSFQYTSWKEPDVASDLIQYNDEYAAVKNGTVYTSANLPSYAVNPSTDVFQVTITDPQGATTTESITVPHYGPYLPPTPPSGGGKKPIAVDLDGDGFEFINVDDSNVFFDVNGDGWKQRTSWVGADDGLLAYDINGDGNINQSNEISFTQYKEGAQSDIEGLRAFDTNGDGIFSALDDKWSNFGIWQDVNQNGVSDAGELRSLDDMGVASIGLTTDGKFEIINGQTVNGVGNMAMQDGSELAFADVALSYSSETAIPQPDGSVDIVSGSPFSPNGEEILGTPDKDLILGKNGNNIIYAYEGDDVIFEDGGNDVIDAGAGNDLVYAGADNDLVMGGTGDDVIYAGLGDDVVFGGDGEDAILAEGGNDVVFGGDGNDFISGGWGNDVLSGDDGNDQVYGESGNDALFGRDGNDELAGMDGTDYLNGGAGNDLLDGGSSADEMIGGTGNDIYAVDNVDDVVTELVNEGIDKVKSSINYTLGENVENLALMGSTDLSGTGNELDNSIKGNEGNNVLRGEAGDDRLNGGNGIDTLIGGTGDDVYIVDNSADIVVEQTNKGNDTIYSSASYVLPENVENMVLIRTSSISGVGNALDNRIIGNNANNLIDGGAGSDVMLGRRGNDSYIVDNINDIIVEYQNQGIDTVFSSIDYALGDNVENVSLTGQSNLNATGNSLNNTITGNDGDNQLNGGTGEDTLIGGKGDDTYVVDDANDDVVENINEGYDTVSSSVTRTLSSNVEKLILSGTGDLDGTGNELNNDLQGNSGDNQLNGGLGVDSMAGGAGNDTYIVDNASDTVTELANDGLDSIKSTVSYVLPENVENITLMGSNAINGIGNALNNTLVGNDASNVLTGLAGNDTLVGNGGNDVLNGGLGADVMTGGTGDDIYTVDNVNDVVTEAVNEGNDTVRSSISYVAPDNVERIELLGGNDINATGNALNNTLLGNSGNNLLDGLAGDDTMAGGLGNDSYVVDSVNDVIYEASDEGIDNVDSSVSYTLADNLESLTLTGSADINATGNNLDNVLQGNSAANQIDGGLGADSMAGAAGDDTYIVDNASDTVTEFTDEGTDTINTSVSYVLPENVENMNLIGDGSINGSGNSAGNILTGNNSDNIISGGAGNDIISGLGGNDSLYGDEGDDILNGGTGNDLLVGGLGVDQLNGGEGDDTYVINMGDNLDTITDISGNDTVRFGEGLSLDNVALRVVEENGIFTAQVRVLDAEGCEQPNQGFNFIITPDTSSLLAASSDNIDDDEEHENDEHKKQGKHDEDDNVGTVSSFISPIELFEFADGSVASFDDLLIKTVVYEAPNKSGKHGKDDDDNEHEGHHGSSAGQEIITGRDDDIVYASKRNDLIKTGSGNDIVYASSGGDAVYGEGGNDILFGDKGDDLLDGGCGVDILSGGKGRDVLVDSAGNSALLGGKNDDIITSGTGNDFIAGGKDDDIITTGAGSNIVAYNKKDGRDTILASMGATNVLSLGGGIDMDDLSFSREGEDLVLNTKHSDHDESHEKDSDDRGKHKKKSAKDSITFKDWYASEQNQNFVSLQIINADYEYEDDKHEPEHDSDEQSEPQVATFDFKALVQQFNESQLLLDQPSSWSLMNGMLDAHLSDSNTQALGGEIAAQYAANGELHMDTGSVQQTLSNPQFGTQAQAVGQQLNTHAIRIG